MKYRVRVKEGANISGQTSNGTRLGVKPSEYDVELTADGILIFIGAVGRVGTDLSVTLADYAELVDFPQVPANKFLEII